MDDLVHWHNPTCADSAKALASQGFCYVADDITALTCETCKTTKKPPHGRP